MARESHSHFKSQAKADHAAKLRHHAAGGRADEAADKRMIAAAIHKHEAKDHSGTPLTKLAAGGKAPSRLDRPGYAKGGRTKHGHTVNVVVAPQGGGGGPPPMMPPHPPMAPPAPPPPPAAPPMMAPHPPMAGPPVGAGVPGMRAAGGRAVGTKDGAGGGKGRLEKIKLYGKKMPEAEQD